MPDNSSARRNQLHGRTSRKLSRQPVQPSLLGKKDLYQNDVTFCSELLSFSLILVKNTSTLLAKAYELHLGIRSTGNLRFMAVHKRSSQVCIFGESTRGVPHYIFLLVAAMSSRLSGETFPSRLPGGMVITQRRAYGVVSRRHDE